MSLLKKLLSAAFPDKTYEIDLHGLRVPEALDRVRDMVAELEKLGGGKVRIICGKGRGSPGGVGVLGEAVCGWLTAHGYGERFHRVMDADGRHGSIMLELTGGSQKAQPQDSLE